MPLVALELALELDVPMPNLALQELDKALKRGLRRPRFARGDAAAGGMRGVEIRVDAERLRAALARAAE